MMKHSKPTVVVTGGCGYIGSHTILQLLRNTSYQVVSIDNNIKSNAHTVDRIESITGVRVPNYSVDLCNRADTLSVFNELKNVTGVIHFAALKSVPESMAKPLWYYQNNINSLANVLNMCASFQIPNFIFSSSCSIYGDVSPEQLPVREETAQAPAVSPYAHTKQIGEDMIRFFVQQHPLNAIALRYFNPVGADMTGELGEDPIDTPTSLVPIITRTAAGKRPTMQVFGYDYPTRDGSCIRDYIHVTDIADAHIAALTYVSDRAPRNQMEAFNLGTGNGVSVLEAISAFEATAERKLAYELGARRPGDVVQIYSDSSKAHQLLGWKPKFDIHDMMASAWRWELKQNSHDD